VFAAVAFHGGMAGATGARRAASPGGGGGELFIQGGMGAELPSSSAFDSVTRVGPGPA
jgi:hypothetical protein